MNIRENMTVYTVDSKCFRVIETFRHTWAGYLVHPEMWSDPNLGEPGYVPKIELRHYADIESILED